MSALFDFIASHRAEMLARLGEHVLLVAAATTIATLIGIPLGILASRRPALGRPLVGLANVAQTIPSLALFGFLIPLPLIGGIGTRTALVALTLYAVLPVVRTTLSGLQSIDRAVLDCAVAMGMTPRQRLHLIELPLAAPSILAGVRVAVVTGVGTATIAAAIGAGGLGDYIFRGLAMLDPVVIVAGALPAALLALLADGMLAAAGRFVDRRGVPSLSRVALTLAAVAAALLLWSSSAAWQRSRGIVVASKNFTEQVILGEILAQTLERSGQFTVERRLNLGGTVVCAEALQRGDVDVYVEYTGTALTALFNQPLSAPQDVLARVTTLYAERGITVLPGLGFNNTFAVLVRATDARSRQLARVSDLAALGGELRAGFGYEFLERPDGYAGLSRTYGLRFRDNPRTMDLNLIYRALAAGEIDVTAGDATSGLIRALDLTVLADDRAYFPPYDAVPLVRADSLAREPALGPALRSLAGAISLADMQRMNHQVDGVRRDPRDVAAEFLATRSRPAP